MRAKSGFTLVEILIVVVILGILAAIVIPQFTDASTEAKQSSLVSDLQTIRSQIELYKAQHNDQIPGTAAGVLFEAAMINYTDVGGTHTSPTKDVANQIIYGPYMREIPKNPFNDLNAVVVTAATGAPAGGGTAGWHINNTTGELHADDTLTCNDAAATPHSSL